MNRDEFCALPSAVALGLLFDALERTDPGTWLSGQPAPELARSPKYDQKIRRKGGFQWASETDVDGLLFWIGRAEEPGDEKWADANAKQAKALRFWLAWRQQNPDARWSGERNHEHVTAGPPMARPQIHEWEPRQTGGGIASDDAESSEAEAEVVQGELEGDDIPF